VKRRQVGYAPEADKDFDWIYDVVALGGGATIALEYVQRLRAFCQRLEHAAERGNRRDDIRTGSASPASKSASPWRSRSMKTTFWFCSYFTAARIGRPFCGE